MYRFLLAGAAAVLALAVFAAPSTARIDHHFSVFAKQVAGGGNQDSFHFKEQLFQASNRSNQVGHDRGRCRAAAQARKFKCKAVIRLNGEIGGNGFLFVKGNFGRGDRRLNVVGGSGDFAGAAGKMTLHGHFLHFALVR